MRVLLPAILAGGLALPGCALYFDDPGDDPGPRSPLDPCALDGLGDAPGYPFDLERYEQDIWPMTRLSCGVSGCHAPDSGSDFTVWPDDGDPCSMTRSFNALYARSTRFGGARSSPVLLAIDGTMFTHPVRYGAGTVEYEALLDYIERAIEANDRELWPYGYFDYEIYRWYIQPMFDDASCAAPGCHEPGAAVAGFALYPSPLFDGLQMESNYEMAASRVDLSAFSASETALYTYATDGHAGAQIADPVTLEIWIEEALSRNTTPYSTGRFPAGRAARSASRARP